MKLIKPKVEILDRLDERAVIGCIATVARTCYKSENMRTADKDYALVKRLIDSKHYAMLEFVDVTVKFTCSRAIAQEITRHRMASYAMESQRYCAYNKDRFNHEITYIIPSHTNYDEGEYSLKYEVANGPFINGLLYSEKAYFDLIEVLVRPQKLNNHIPLLLPFL